MLRRILFLITDLQIGGTPTVVRELALRLNDPPTVEIEVACLSKWGPVADQILDADVRVTAFDARGPQDLIGAVRELRRLIRVGRFDTVCSFLIHANAVASLASIGLRDVRFIQSIQTTQPNPRWHWWLQSLLHYKADRVVVPSPSAARVAHDWSGVPSDKLVVIPNAIDPAQFDPFKPRQSTRPLPIGFIGRLDPVKRIPDLLRAVGLLRDRVHLHLFGDGAEREHIQREITRLALRSVVTLHGAIPRPQEALAQIELLVLPSDAEGFGLVLIEAMAAGVPVVATRVAGIRDVVTDNQTGLLVPPRDPGALARAIERLVEDDALRQRLARAGLEEVRQKYVWEVVIPQYRRLFQLQIAN